MKVYVKTFGCRVNQAEGDSLRAALLASPGNAAAEGWEDADLCLLNTCTVTAEADREAFTLMRRITRRNPAARLLVAGCLAERDPAAVRDAAPAATVVGHAEKAGIPALFGCAAAPADVSLPSASGRSRAFLKVQDGCNMDCAYCIIPSVRSELSSVPLPDLLDRARGLVGEGVPELVLCGIRLGRYLWRAPEGKRADLPGLIENLLALPGNFRVRLSSLEVTDATDRLLALMAESGGRLCPSLHLPLQSGSAATLARMRRWYTPEFYRRRVESYRTFVPGGSLFADVMTGFPGETEGEHEESIGFARELAFDGFHLFRYSPRPGTEAAPWRAPSADVVRSRAAQWRALDRESRAAHAARSVGGKRVVAPEMSGRDGLTEDFLSVSLDRPVGGGLAPVRIVRAESSRAFASAL